MECRIISKIVFFIIVGLLLLSSCYYDNYDDLVVESNGCDTINMTYSLNIKPIMDKSCTSCHSGAAPAGNISLDTYDNTKKSADDGSLLGSMQHESGYSPMPKNQVKLDDCTINIISAWINQGSKY